MDRQTRTLALRQSGNSVSQLRDLVAQRDLLHERMQILRDRAEGTDAPLTDGEQVALAMGQSLIIFAGTHIDAALQCLAHNGKAFAQFKGVISRALFESFGDSARDDIAYAELQGLTGDAVAAADMLLVSEHIAAATRIHERIFAILEKGVAAS